MGEIIPEENPAEAKPIIEAIREYFLDCDLLQTDSPLGVENLSKEESYSINQLPSQGEGVLKSYINGDKVYGFDFTFASRFAYTEASSTQIANSGFYEGLVKWIKEETAKGNLPEVDGAMEIKVTQTPYVFMADPSGKSAEYQILLQLVYKRKGSI